MGFYSYVCNVSNLSIPAFPWAEMPEVLSMVQLKIVSKANPSISRTAVGTYDGYGRVGNADIIEILNELDLGFNEVNICVTRLDHLDKLTEDKPSKVCKAQGYFYTRAEARKLFLSAIKIEKKS